MAHKLEHLNFDDVEINQLTIHSFEMGVYLAEVDFDGRNEFIVSSDNRPKSFRSVGQVQAELSRARIKSTILVHQSAYDEMIGLTGRCDNRLIIKLK